jgi:hypothetical protein
MMVVIELLDAAAADLERAHQTSQVGLCLKQVDLEAPLAEAIGSG